VSSLISSRADDSSTTTNVTDTTNIRSPFASLLQRLESVSRYVDDVVAGKVVADPKVGRYLAETIEIAAIPEGEEYQRIYQQTVQDHLMNIYISHLMKTQLHLAKKLEALAV
jgi:hypothetical protein